MMRSHKSTVGFDILDSFGALGDNGVDSSEFELEHEDAELAIAEEASEALRGTKGKS